MKSPIGVLALQVLLLVAMIAGSLAKAHAKRVEATRRAKVLERMVVDHPPAYSRQWTTHGFAHRRSVPSRLHAAA